MGRRRTVSVWLPAAAETNALACCPLSARTGAPASISSLVGTSMRGAGTSMRGFGRDLCLHRQQQACTQRGHVLVVLPDCGRVACTRCQMQRAVGSRVHHGWVGLRGEQALNGLCLAGEGCQVKRRGALRVLRLKLRAMTDEQSERRVIAAERAQVERRVPVPVGGGRVSPHFEQRPYRLASVQPGRENGAHEWSVTILARAFYAQTSPKAIAQHRNWPVLGGMQ